MNIMQLWLLAISIATPLTMLPMRIARKATQRAHVLLRVRCFSTKEKAAALTQKDTKLASLRSSSDRLRQTVLDIINKEAPADAAGQKKYADDLAAAQKAYYEASNALDEAEGPYAVTPGSLRRARFLTVDKEKWDHENNSRGR